MGAAPGAPTQPQQHRNLPAGRHRDADSPAAHCPGNREKALPPPGEVPPPFAGPLCSTGGGARLGRGPAQEAGPSEPPSSYLLAPALSVPAVRYPPDTKTKGDRRLPPGPKICSRYESAGSLSPPLEAAITALRPHLHYPPFNPRRGGEAGIQLALIFIAHSSLDLWVSKAESIRPENVAICGYLCILRVAPAGWLSPIHKSGSISGPCFVSSFYDA